MLPGACVNAPDVTLPAVSLVRNAISSHIMTIGNRNHIMMLALTPPMANAAMMPASKIQSLGRRLTRVM